MSNHQHEYHRLDTGSNEGKMRDYVTNNFIPVPTCHRKILEHRKYFEMLDRYNPREVICNQSNMHLRDIQLQDRICTFEDCSKLPLIYNSMSNKTSLKFLHLLHDCMSDEHARDLSFRISFSSTSLTEFDQINLRLNKAQEHAQSFYQHYSPRKEKKLIRKLVSITIILCARVRMSDYRLLFENNNLISYLI